MRNELNGWYVASVEAPVKDRVSKFIYRGWMPCIEWCEQTFGVYAVDGWRFVGEGVFEFREEQDYVMFLLRWA